MNLFSLDRLFCLCLLANTLAHTEFPDPYVPEKVATELHGQGGTLYSVSPVSSKAEFEEVSKKLTIDFRIQTDDTDEKLSCFKGVSLDPDHSRAELFCIKQGASIIGVATLLSVPYKNLDKRLYVKQKKNHLVVQSPIEIYHIKKKDTFLVEVGWLQLLPAYRKKHLGQAIVAQVLIPTIKKLLRQTSGDVLVTCCAEGAACTQVQSRLSHAITLYTLGKVGKIVITNEIQSLIGKIAEGAFFTPATATRMNLSEAEDFFDISLGPVFSHWYRGLLNK